MIQTQRDFITQSPRSIMDPENTTSKIAAAEEGTRADGVSSSNSAGESGDASSRHEAAPKGILLKSGRVRLPDKLMEYLNKEASEALYWMPDGESFALDTETAQEKLLDKFFSGTKLSSFLRSISRW